MDNLHLLNEGAHLVNIRNTSNNSIQHSEKEYETIKRKKKDQLSEAKNKEQDGN